MIKRGPEVSGLELIRTIYQTGCRSYDPEVLIPNIEEHLDSHIGKIDLSDKRVLLKVNMLSGKVPESAVTTHPNFLFALAKVLIDRGAVCTIGDSPGGPFTVSALKKMYRISGYEDVAKRTGARLNYDISGSDRSIPEGRFIKRILISNYINGHDISIALPKIKTHTLMGLTCASKIMFGAVPGLEKVRLHGRFQTPGTFARMLLDLTRSVKPDLFLVDGIVGMDGEGPAKGRPREIGIVLSGRDNIEIDLHICKVCGLDIKDIPIFDEYIKMYHTDLPAIDIRGHLKDFVLDPPFEPARGWTVSRNPPRILKNVSRWALSGKPMISKESCTGCMFCLENCAGDAISSRKGKANIDFSKCIRCYCCHELCPEGAIMLKDPPLISSRILQRLTRPSDDNKKE